MTVSGDTSLTATWLDVPGHHNHPETFTVTLQFSREVDTTASDLQDHAIGYDGATVTTVRATTPGSTRNWTVTLTPTSENSPVYVGVWQVQQWESCDQRHTICSGNERLASNAMIEVPARF